MQGMRHDILQRLPLPLAPANIVLNRLMRGMAARHPSILRRLGPHADKRIMIDVTDAPPLLLMQPQSLRLTAHRRTAPPGHDAVIRGRLSAFLAMLHGGEDGDALFFSGELEIAGDTSAVLALRNAIDDAELDLTEEIAAETGRAGPVMRRISRLVARQSGLTLSRQEIQA